MEILKHRFARSESPKLSAAGLRNNLRLKTFRKAFIVSALSIIVALGAFSPINAEAKLSGKSVKIGTLFPMTGFTAEWGYFSQIISQMAVDEINAAGGVGGVPMELVNYDDACKGDQAIPLIRKLALSDKVLAVSGPCCSTVCKQVFPQLNTFKLVAVSNCSTAPGLTELSIWGFRNTLTSDKQLEPALRWWAKTNNIKTGVIIYDAAHQGSAAEGKGVMPELFKKYNINLLDSITFQSGDIDYSAQVTKTKALNPDGVAIGSCPQEAGNLVREMRKQGLKQAIVGGTCVAAFDFIKIGGKATEGAVVTTAAWPDDPDPKVQNFIANVAKRTGGKKPAIDGAFRAYDNIYIMKKVIEEEGVTNKPEDLDSDRDKIRQGWAKLKNFSGVSGVTSIDSNRDGIGEPKILVVKDGKFVKIESQ